MQYYIAHLPFYGSLITKMDCCQFANVDEMNEYMIEKRRIGSVKRVVIIENLSWGEEK